MVLHEERPVVQTEAVPVERVRLGTETVTDEETVTGQVRKEQVEVDDPTGTTGTRGNRRRWPLVAPGARRGGLTPPGLGVIGAAGRRSGAQR